MKNHRVHVLPRNTSTARLTNHIFSPQLDQDYRHYLHSGRDSLVEMRART